jgi:hypothetical protein
MKYKRQPKEYMSEDKPVDCPVSTSGAMYPLVPDRVTVIDVSSSPSLFINNDDEVSAKTADAAVAAAVAAALPRDVVTTTRANSKSVNKMRPSSFRRMFDGLISYRHRDTEAQTV